VNQGIGFSPAAKISYDFTKKITGGFEYYADYGSITNIASLHNQQQQLFPTSSNARIVSLRTVSRSTRSVRTSYPRPGVSGMAISPAGETVISGSTMSSAQ
jgi:hypothetical protein